MSTRPRMSATRMAAIAPGFRAMASAAEAVALPWPIPQRPAAIPIAIYAAALRFASAADALAPASCASIGLARASNPNASMINLFFIVFSLLNCLQEVVQHHALGRRALTLKAYKT